MKLQGTEFQIKVWKAIGNIPKGKILTYKELAKTIGKPKAARAIANACGKNPYPIKIPCHRVISKNYKQGGFSLYGGIVHKDILLKNEK